MPHCLGFLVSFIDLESKYSKAFGFGVENIRKIFENGEVVLSSPCQGNFPE